MTCPALQMLTRGESSGKTMMPMGERRNIHSYTNYQGEVEGVCISVQEEVHVN